MFHRINHDFAGLLHTAAFLVGIEGSCAEVHNRFDVQDICCQCCHGADSSAFFEVFQSAESNVNSHFFSGLFEDFLDLGCAVTFFCHFYCIKDGTPLSTTNTLSANSSSFAIACAAMQEPLNALLSGM